MKKLIFAVSIILLSSIIVSFSYKSVKDKKEDGVVTVITDQNFDKTIKKGVVLVDFWAVWCRPCRMQAPIIEEIAKEYKGKAKMCKLDVDQNKIVSNKYNIVNIPTLMIFKDGKMVEKFVGMQQKAVITAALDKYVKK